MNSYRAIHAVLSRVRSCLPVSLLAGAAAAGVLLIGARTMAKPPAGKPVGGPPVQPPGRARMADILGDRSVNWNGAPVVDAGANQTVYMTGYERWTPAALPLAAWYDAADSNSLALVGGKVSQWHDKSGNSNHVSQAAEANRPTFGTAMIGGQDVVSFRVADKQALSAPNHASLNLDSTGGVNVFAIMQYYPFTNQNASANAPLSKGRPLSGDPSYGMSVSSNNNSIAYKVGSTSASGGIYTNQGILFSGISVTNSRSVYVNGALGATSTSGTFTNNNTDPLYLGRDRDSGRYANVDFGEILIVGGSLSVAERQKIEGYLAHKWGMATNLPAGHPYKSEAPRIYSATATLVGAVSDTDGNAMTTVWSRESGPAAVSFMNPTATNTDVSFTTNGVYTLRLTADDSVAQGFDEVVLTVEAEGTSPIATPTGLAATVVATNQIDLVWTDNSTNETDFVIQRSATSGSGFGFLASVGANVTSYADTSVGIGQAWYYRVMATNSEASSPPSPQASATITKLLAMVTLGNLSQTYSGSASPVTVTTAPTGLAVQVTYNGVGTPPINAGSYAVDATIDSATYEGGTNGTLVIAKSNPTVTAWPTAAAIIEGQSVGSATLTGGSGSVAGRFSYLDRNALLPVGSYAVNVVFEPADWVNYATVSGTVTVVASTNPAATWRSALYPPTWTPVDKDAEGRFLHDFSNAGYRKGETPIPMTPPGLTYDVTAAPYHADNTGSSDATAAIQAAIDAAGTAGGGIVYLPAGTYKIAPGASSYALSISKSGVVLRGAGTNLTYLCNTQTVMRGKSVIQVQPSSGDWHTPLAGTTILATADIGYPTRTISLASVGGLSVGDTIIVRADCTADFIADHGMTSFIADNGTTNIWTSSLDGPTICRRIIGIDVDAKTIVIDIPTRYYMKMSDNARIYKIDPLLEESGISDLSIGMIQNPTPGWGDEDYDVEGTGAYEVHGAHAIKFKHVGNSWIQRVATYRPAANTNDVHLVSNGIRLDESIHMTVRDTVIQKPQYEGGGGNGYGYIMSGSDNLVTECLANDCRHNYDFGSMRTTGNVIHKSEGRFSRLASDFHMHLSMGNMFDSMTINGDFLEAKYRPFGTLPHHGHTTTESVFWNTYGEGTGTAVDSAQWKWGYVIGTSGGRSGVTRGTANNTAPEDFLEGQGTGNTLSPQSLYLDQLSKRMQGVLVNAGADFTTATNAAVPIAGSVYTYGAGPVSQIWSQVTGPTASFADSSSPTTTVSLLEDGVYVLALTAWDAGKTNSATLTITVGSPVTVPVAPSAWHYIRGETETNTLPVGYYQSASSTVGTGGVTGSRDDRNAVFGFALPTLQAGATLDSATFNVEISAARDSTGGQYLPELHAYLLNTANPASTGTNFFYHGALDPSVNTKRVGTTSVIIPSGVTTQINYSAGQEVRSFSLTGDALTLLKSYYAGHVPTQSNVYFRFNMSVDPAINTFRRYNVNTSAGGSSLVLTSFGGSKPESYKLSVISAHGQPTPSGVTTNAAGTNIVARLSGSPDEIPGAARYVCTGWARTGSEPASGTGTNTSFTLTNDTTLVWQWQTNYWVNLQIKGE